MWHLGYAGACWHARCEVRGIPIKIMKTIHHLTSALVAAGSAGVAFLTLSHLISAEFGFALLAIIALTGFVLFDYARPMKSLRPPAPVLRPTLPSASPSATSTDCCARAA